MTAARQRRLLGASSGAVLATPLSLHLACHRGAQVPSPTAQAAFQAREGYVEAAAGIRLFYQLEGTGPEVVVFVQGGPGTDLREVAPDFAALTQCRTVIHCTRSCRAEWPPGP